MATVIDSSALEVFERMAKDSPTTVDVDEVNQPAPVSSIVGLTQLCEGHTGQAIKLSWFGDGIGVVVRAVLISATAGTVSLELIHVWAKPGGVRFRNEGSKVIVTVSDLTLQPWLEFVR